MAQITGPIIKLMLYEGTDYNTALLAMTPTHVVAYSQLSNAWTDITGTALTGISTTQAQWTTHKGVTVFTNDQHDRPRKYIGTGDTVQLGGTPPKAVVICDYMKYLFLWNVVTADGTFPRQGIYSTDYDNDWSSCNGFEINLDETPGEVRAALAQGAYQFVYKADCIAAVRWVGGPVRFQQEILPFDEGILAPDSLQAIGNAGHLFLATDLQLYTNIQGQIKVLPGRVIDILQKTMDESYASRCTSFIDSDKDTYYLFYKTSSDDSHARGRIAYNFRTGEFGHRTYAGHEFLDVVGLKFSPNEKVRSFAAATDDRVYEINVDIATTDAGVSINRYYTSDTQDFGSPDQKIVRSVELLFTRTPGTRVKVAIATDDEERFEYEEGFDLRGRHGDSTVVVEYEPPQPLEGVKFNLRIRMFHDRANARVELRSIKFKWDKVSTASDVATPHQGNQVM